MKEINLRSGVPIYKQIINNYKDQIISGVLSPDARLPSIRALASDLQINPNTIKKAYMILEQENYIYSVQGRGSFVVKIDKHQLDIQKDEMKNLLLATLEKARNLNMDEDVFIQFVKTCMKENSK